MPRPARRSWSTSSKRAQAKTESEVQPGRQCGCKTRPRDFCILRGVAQKQRQAVSIRLSLEVEHCVAKRIEVRVHHRGDASSIPAACSRAEPDILSRRGAKEARLGLKFKARIKRKPLLRSSRHRSTFWQRKRALRPARQDTPRRVFSCARTEPPFVSDRTIRRVAAGKRHTREARRCRRSGHRPSGAGRIGRNEYSRCSRDCC